MVVCACACVWEEERGGARRRRALVHTFEKAPSHPIPSILVCPPVVVIARGGVVVVLECPNIHACSVNTIPPLSLSLSLLRFFR
jgi:hypothetical protein